jgi:hypothetical protein
VTRVAVTAALSALVLCPAAAAHGGGGARGFKSTVTAVVPPTPGLEATVLESDDRIGLRNKTGKTILVFGYEREPYLRMTSDAVYRNARSPATYLNDDRYGRVQLPDQADPKAASDWKQVAGEPYYEWHDHRIHWMSPIDPPQVRRAKGVPHHIFDWSVPILVGGQRSALKGSLDYKPPPTSRFHAVLIVPLGALALGGAAAWWWRRARAA